MTKIPTFIKQPIVNEDKTPSDSMQLFMDNLQQQMQLTLSDEGWVVPSRSTADIDNIANPSSNNSRPDGTIWYDNQTNQLKAKISGIVKVIQVA